MTVATELDDGIRPMLMQVFHHTLHDAGHAERLVPAARSQQWEHQLACHPVEEQQGRKRVTMGPQGVKELTVAVEDLSKWLTEYLKGKTQYGAFCAAMQRGRGGDAENRRGGDTGMGGEPHAKGDYSQDRVRHRQGQGEGRP